METFPREALVDELLVTTQSEPELCHRSSLPSSAEREGDGSDSLLLTVGDYRALTQLARQVWHGDVFEIKYKHILWFK
jgi:hypothetical protein